MSTKTSIDLYRICEVQEALDLIYEWQLPLVVIDMHEDRDREWLLKPPRTKERCKPGQCFLMQGWAHLLVALVNKFQDRTAWLTCRARLHAYITVMWSGALQMTYWTRLVFSLFSFTGRHPRSAICRPKHNNRKSAGVWSLLIYTTHRQSCW